MINMLNRDEAILDEIMCACHFGSHHHQVTDVTAVIPPFEKD